MSISYTDDECSVSKEYAPAVNRELMRAALKSMTVLISARDAGSQSCHLADFCHIKTCLRLFANFSASSPYVTAVGATTTDTSNHSAQSPGKYREIVTCTEDGALITSGGDFWYVGCEKSSLERSVGPYLELVENAGLSPFFNTNSHAYPDITGLGHSFNMENGDSILRVSSIQYPVSLLQEFLASDEPQHIRMEVVQQIKITIQSDRGIQMKDPLLSKTRGRPIGSTKDKIASTKRKPPIFEYAAGSSQLQCDFCKLYGHNIMHNKPMCMHLSVMTRLRSMLPHKKTTWTW